MITVAEGVGGVKAASFRQTHTPVSQPFVR